MKNTILLCTLLLFTSCVKKSSEKDNRIPVLNFATFHMRYSPDKNTVEFDQHNKENQKEVHRIAKMLSKFKPTVILVEKLPSENKELQQSFNQYLENKDIVFETPSEIELLAFELGRLSDTKHIYGINHKMEYGFMKVDSIGRQLNEQTYINYMSKLQAFLGEKINNATTIDKLKVFNDNDVLNMLLEVNADIMTHVSTPNKFEGADEAAKFYKRNLRMYSIMNSIQLKKTDRVFVLMGAAHTAFFRDFMSRSPKYKMVNTFDYLK